MMYFQKGHKINLGKIYSEEHKKNISNALKGKKKTEKWCRNISLAKKGIHLSEETKRKIRLANKGKINLCEKNGNWKGDRVQKGGEGIHNWIRRRKPKPELCEECKKVVPYDLTNISGKYKRDVNDYKWLCRRCHMLSDGRLKFLI